MENNLVITYNGKEYEDVYLKLTQYYKSTIVKLGFPDGSDSKESASSAGDLGLIPGSGRSPEEGHGNLLQYSCLDTSMV